MGTVGVKHFRKLFWEFDRLDIVPGRLSGLGSITLGKYSAYMTKKYFTVAEANALIPDLMECVPRLQSLYSSMMTQFPDMKQVREKVNLNSGSPQGAEYLRVALTANKVVKHFEDMGCVLKGIENGLVDFPALREGKEVLLCWKMPEKEILFWHDLNSGFAGRQPI